MGEFFVIMKFRNKQITEIHIKTLGQGLQLYAMLHVSEYFCKELMKPKRSYGLCI